mmetsp:Transcript_145284/g.253565  ORF Transcript_145284/g.253565 Transcript_145284/m.253565 type:complete len:214 (+) Transcript_145284:413-1054(+)
MSTRLVTRLCVGKRSPRSPSVFSARTSVESLTLTSDPPKTRRWTTPGRKWMSPRRKTDSRKLGSMPSMISRTKSSSSSNMHKVKRRTHCWDLPWPLAFAGSLTCDLMPRSVIKTEKTDWFNKTSMMLAGSHCRAPCCQICRIAPVAEQMHPMRIISTHGKFQTSHAMPLQSPYSVNAPPRAMSRLGDILSSMGVVTHSMDCCAETELDPLGQT